MVDLRSAATLNKFRVDVLILGGEVIGSFDTWQEAARFARPLSFIPGNMIALVWYDGERILDIMAWNVQGRTA